MAQIDHNSRRSTFSTLGELCAYHDERFIRLAYLALLQKEPEAKEIGPYFAIIREKPGPAEILAKLRITPTCLSKIAVVDAILTKMNDSVHQSVLTANNKADLFPDSQIEHIFSKGVIARVSAILSKQEQ